MSHTRVKTTYSVEGAWGSIDTESLYCHHNHSNDTTVFYNSNGSIQDMCFGEWERGNDLWDAMERLWMPFKDKWNGDLKDNVEYYIDLPI